MKISSNITSMMIVANMNKANKSGTTAMQRLSSGLRIGSTKDDPAGWAIANKLDSQVQGLSQANKNAMDGISLVQTTEGALNEVHSMLNRMKELSIQGVNDSVTESDREKIQSEMDELIEEIKSIAERTDFNGINLLNSDDKIMLQTGANAYESMQINGSELKLNSVVKTLDGINVMKASDDETVSQILNRIDAAVNMVSDMRGKLGAFQNRLEYTVTNLDVSEENTTESLSRIQDADMAEEMTNYTLHNVIAQSGIAMLAQANQRPQQILQLLNS